ncbi:MAG: porin [Pseudomonadales bacterium]
MSMPSLPALTLAAAALFSMSPAGASTSPAPENLDLETMWQLLQAQQAEIAALKAELRETRDDVDDTRDKVVITEEQLSATADYLDQVEATRSSSATHIGGYGEMHYNNLETDAGEDIKEVDYHRFVLFFNHDFNDRLRFVSELELEHSLAGDGAPGEVELEQAYVEYDLNENHYARTGLFLLPVGILNETHEPPTFYGVERNDVENIIIPTTWWEGGAGVGGRYGNGLSWDFAVHSGLEMPTDGSSAFRVRSGRQKVAEALADDLAWTARVKYTGVPGLELAASYQYQQDASQLARDGLDEGELVSVHGIWTRGPFSLRGLWAEWNFDGDLVELADADKQTGWYVEPSVRLNLAGTDWGFYTRYEDLEGARLQDRFDQWELGFNFYPHPNVVLKADWRNRDHDLASESGRDFKGFDLGVGYQF